jgi:peroxiredoxin-like protein
MTNFKQPESTRPQTILFETKLDWVTQQQGVLSAQNISDTIRVATPLEFGGEGSLWSPEHLFLASISSCFMTTYLAFANKFRFTISDFTCNVIGEIGLVSGKYQFTRINIFPIVYISEQALKETARKALHKTQEYCLISHSVAAALIYHPEVRVGERPESENVNTIRDFYARL